jgi:hypothetical protein
VPVTPAVGGRPVTVAARHGTPGASRRRLASDRPGPDTRTRIMNVTVTVTGPDPIPGLGS